MGANDTGEQLQAAIAECILLEQEISRLQQELETRPALTIEQILALATHFDLLQENAKTLGEKVLTPSDLHTAVEAIWKAADTIILAARAERVRR